MLFRCWVLLTLGGAAMAQIAPASGSIGGEVRDPGGKALAEISMVLTGSPDGRRTAKTDAQGAFTFEGLAAARYQLTAMGRSGLLGAGEGCGGGRGAEWVG